MQCTIEKEKREFASEGGGGGSGDGGKWMNKCGQGRYNKLKNKFRRHKIVKMPIAGNINRQRQ